MVNVKTHSNKLKLACAIAFVLFINIVIGIMAGTGIAYAARAEHKYGTSDLNVGDKIKLSGMTWRVIQKESEGTTTSGLAGEETRGILLRLDSSLQGYFDDQANNTVTSYRASDVSIAGAPLNYDRGTYGTNYLEEATIRDFLRTQILDKITETGVVASIPQQQTVWWGEARYIDPESTSSSIAGESAQTFKAADGVLDTGAGKGKTLDIQGITFDRNDSNAATATTGSATVDQVATAENDENVFRYTINDQIFLPNANQLKIVRDSGIKDLYSSDSLTRVPFANNPYSGTQILKVEADNNTLKAVASSSVGSSQTESNIVPMMYLDLNTTFETRNTPDTNGYITYSDASNESDEYGYSDVLVGDYITMGGMEWRVIGKDATTGLKLRLDVVGDTRPFDAARGQLPSSKDEVVERPAINGVTSKVGSDQYGTSRSTTGSNLYWESDVRKYLTGEFLNNFSTYELEQINVVTQAMAYWWGDELEYSPIGDNTQYARTTGRLTFIEDTKTQNYEAVHFSRFDPNSGLYVPFAGGTVNGNTLSKGVAPLAGQEVPQLITDDPNRTEYNYTFWNSLLNDSTASTWINELSKMKAYAINDMFFESSMTDIAKIYQLGLTNKNGSNYSIAIDSRGYDAGQHTSTPSLPATTQSDIVYSGTGIRFYNTNRSGSSGPANYTGITNYLPITYLKPDVDLDVVSTKALNPGEKDFLRPSKITSDDKNYNSRRGWRNFAIATDGKLATDVTADDFAGATVAQSITKIQLATSGKFSLETAPDGMSIDNNNVLSWTPTKAGSVTFKIKDSVNGDGSDITVDVAQGKVVVTNPSQIQGSFGFDVSALPVPTATTKNILNNDITGVWAWRSGEPKLPDDNTDGNTTTRVAVFTPNGGFANNYETTEYSFTILLSDSNLQGVIEGLLDGKSVKAKYGQTLDQVLPQLQAIVDGQNPPIIATWDKLAQDISVLDVGTYSVNATFEQGGITATLPVTVVIEAIEASAPGQDKLNNTPTAVYGDTLVVVVDYLNDITNWSDEINGTFAASDTSTTVGDVGERTHKFTFDPHNGNFTATTVDIKVTVTKATRTETQLDRISTEVGKKLTDLKIVSGTKFSEITLPAGFKLAPQDNSAVTGKAGEEVEIKLIVGSAVKEDANNGTADNYEEATITTKFTIADSTSQNSNVVLIIVLVVVGLAVVGGAVFFVLKKKQSAGSKF